MGKTWVHRKSFKRHRRPSYDRHRDFDYDSDLNDFDNMEDINLSEKKGSDYENHPAGTHRRVFRG